MIRNYGQAPRQLFPKHPHPRRTPIDRRSGPSAPPSDLFGISWLIRLLLSHQQSQEQQKEDDCDQQQQQRYEQQQSALEPEIAIVKSPSMDEGDSEGSGAGEEVGVAVSASVIPLTAGAPLDTVKGLAWGRWAGNPSSQPVMLPNCCQR